jgi:hypothetical protein
MQALQWDLGISTAIFKAFGPVRCAETLPVLVPGRLCLLTIPAPISTHKTQHGPCSMEL